MDLYPGTKMLTSDRFCRRNQQINVFLKAYFVNGCDIIFLPIYCKKCRTKFHLRKPKVDKVMKANK